MGKSRSKGNIFKKDEKKFRENIQFRKNLALGKYIPRKYEGPKSSLSLNFEGNRSVRRDINDDAWILRVVTPTSARTD
jgi:hypothetical protein